MRPRPITLSAVTRQNRHGVMAEINDAVMASGGWVVNHTLFSNIATVFQLALPPARLAAFADKVNALGVHIDAESWTKIADAAPAGSGEEIIVSLTVTFVHDEPDLKRTVPMVPG